MFAIIEPAVTIVTPATAELVRVWRGMRPMMIRAPRAGSMHHVS